MSLYVLVEGFRTEKKVYPSWISARTGMVKKDMPDNPNPNDFYIISGYGYPCIITTHLQNAIIEINNYGYDHFWIVVDADEEDIDQRKQYIQSNIQKYNLKDTVIVSIIIQQVCIETFGLGNRDFFPSICSENLKIFKERYDVTTEDPACLFTSKKIDGYNSASFHEKYLKEIFCANNLRYSKKKPGKFMDPDFFLGIKKRFEETGHILSFNELLLAIDKIS